MNCLAPTEDSAYFMSSRLPLPDHRVYAVVGAWALRPATLLDVGLGLNVSTTLLGFDNIEDYNLADTANRYTAAPNHERFFSSSILRVICTDLEDLTAGSNCYSIGDQLRTAMTLRTHVRDACPFCAQLPFLN